MTSSPISKLTYSQAVGELEKILAEMQSDAPEIDTLAAQTERAAKLIEHCRAKLLKTEEELKKTLEK